jgi:hypothetical protein
LFHKVDAVGFQDDMARLHLDIMQLVSLASNMDVIWSTFREGIHAAVHTHVPTKIRRTKPAHEPLWFNKFAARACAKQRRQYSRYKDSGIPEHLATYKSTRKLNKKAFRTMKRRYLTDKLFAPFEEGNTKPFFQYVKNLKGNNNAIHSIETRPGHLTQDKMEMASVLNSFFQSVFSQSSDMPGINFDVNFPPIVVTKNGVLKLLQDLKRGKGCGPDQISKQMMVLDIHMCAEILTVIFNHSINTGSLPEEWKMANVAPDLQVSWDSIMTPIVFLQSAGDFTPVRQFLHKIVRHLSYMSKRGKM